jgi:uncharacterized protein (DUF1501 family)
MISRRTLLKSAIAVPGFWLLPSRAEVGNDPGSTLVVVFQRGAVDGLSMLIPYTEAAYYDRRPAIAIPPPGRDGNAQSLRLNDQFALHPALQPFHALYEQGKLVPMPACGSPDSSRSHFNAQDTMESGVAGDRSVRDGWMNRALAQLGAGSFAAVAMTTTLPRSLRGDRQVLNFPDLDQYDIGYADAYGNIQRDEAAASTLARLYAGDDLGAHSFSAIQKLRDRKYRSTSVSYPDGDFSHQLSQLAQLIKSGLGVRLAFVEIEGWDTHANQGDSVGQLAGNLYRLAYGIDAFLKDLGEFRKSTAILTMSEFGRTVSQNGNRGTDHGHGTTFFAIGDAVAGGRIGGEFPGLDEGSLYQGRDLAIATDFRDVIAELLRNHLAMTDLASVLPGHSVRDVPIVRRSAV